MLKKILAFVVMLYAATAFAAVDVNKASAADLDSVSGIGPAISTKIIEERKKGNFKDWQDLIARVGGVGDKSAVKLSAGGLTVNGASFKGVVAAPAAAAAKKEDKPMAKAEEKKADAKPMATAAAATPAPAAAPGAKPVAAASAAAAKDAKPEVKAEAKATVAKKDDKPAAVADAVKPAASAAKK